MTAGTLISNYPPVVAFFQPGNPSAGNNTTSAKMMGIGSTCQVTPATTGKCTVTISGLYANSVASGTVTIQGRHGLVSGGVPTNGAAASGTQFAVGLLVVTSSSTAAGWTPFTISEQASLNALTAYWFDLALTSPSGSDTVTVSSLQVTIIESN